MINKQTTITGEKTPIGTETTQDAAKKTLKETLDTMIYTNPLLQRTKPEDLTQENFPRYQKDMENILRELLGQISFLKTTRNPENIIRNNWTENIKEAKRLCKFLEEYCHKVAGVNLSLPYKYLGNIAHKLKPTAESIEITRENRKQNQDQGNRFEFGKKQFDTIMSNIQKNIQNIKNIHLTESNMYIKKAFSPYEESQKIIDMYTSNIKYKDIHIENNLPQDLSIESYQDIFETTMENLISNAIKFTPKGGKITLEINENSDKRISFSIKDTGIGIPSGTDVFARGYTTPSLEGKPGTGLGLADSKLFIEMMEEKIEHKDNTPHGTIFTFSMKKTPSQKDLQK